MKVSFCRNSRWGQSENLWDGLDLEKMLDRKRP